MSNHGLRNLNASYCHKQGVLSPYYFVPLSYSFGGHFKSTYAPISSKFWPLKVVRPSILALEPFLTYTLIRLWCKLMLKTLFVTFFKLLLKNLWNVKGLQQTLFLYQVVLWCSFLFKLSTWAAQRRGHHYWIIFKHEAKWPP